jgi:hypothetical protein
MSNIKSTQLLDKIEASIKEKDFIYLAPRPIISREKTLYAVLRSHNWHKIGVTNNLDRRFAEIQGYNAEVCEVVFSVSLVGDVFGAEKTLLKNIRNQLRSSAWRGEWVRNNTQTIIKTMDTVLGELIKENKKQLKADTKMKSAIVSEYAPDKEFVQTSVGVTYV